MVIYPRRTGSVYLLSEVETLQIMLMALDSPDARPDLTDWISCSGPLGPPGPENGSMTHSAHIADTPRHTRPEADLNKVQSCLLCAWHFCVLIKEINTHICKARH